MKRRILYYLIVTLLLTTLQGCKSWFEKFVVYTTLEELSQEVSTTETSFSINVKNLEVTAVNDEYVQLQDMTAGALMHRGYNDLSVGLSISGKIKGYAKYVDGYLTITSIDLYNAKRGVATRYFTMGATLNDLTKSPEKFSNRKIVVSDVTIVDSFTGHKGESVQVTGGGNSYQAFACYEDLRVDAPWQGDLVCYLSDGRLLIYDFEESEAHEITNPFLYKKQPGIYDVEDDIPNPVLTWAGGNIQMGCGSQQTSCWNYFVDMSREWLVRVDLNADKLVPGAQANLSVGVLGRADILPSNNMVYIQKITPTNIWVVDYNNNKGYILERAEAE